MINRDRHFKKKIIFTDFKNYFFSTRSLFYLFICRFLLVVNVFFVADANRGNFNMARTGPKRSALQDMLNNMGLEEEDSYGSSSSASSSLRNSNASSTTDDSDLYCKMILKQRTVFIPWISRWGFINYFISTI